MKAEDLKVEFNRKQTETRGYCQALKWVADQLAKGEKVEDTKIQTVEEVTKPFKK